MISTVRTKFERFVDFSRGLSVLVQCVPVEQVLQLTSLSTGQTSRNGNPLWPL